MSAGRSADGREVQIPLQQVPPSLAPPLSLVPPTTPPPHRQANPWPPSDSTPPQGKHLLIIISWSLRCDSLRVLLIHDYIQEPDVL